MCSSSASLIIGIIGAAITPTGTPASASSRIARSRACGAEARGSIFDDRWLSRVVTEKYTVTSPRRAIGAIRSRSRTTPAFLVIRLKGCEHSLSTSISERVIL